MSCIVDKEIDTEASPYYKYLFVEIQIFLSGAHGVSATVHGQRDPGAEGGVVRGEEGDGARHLGRLAGPPQRVRRLGVLQELVVLLLVEAAALLQLGDDDAGVDAVDADLLGRQLQRHAPGELIQRGLGHIVGQHTWDNKSSYLLTILTFTWK